MRIGIDGLPLTSPKTGVGHYTFELARALAEIDPASDFQLVYPSTYPPVAISDNFPANLRMQRTAVGPLGRHWWSVGLPRYIRGHELDLFHGTNFDVPLWHRCATVLTIHDLSQFLHPETHLSRSVKRARRRLPTMTRTADAIICPTESVRREVCEQLGAAGQKVFAVPEAARATFTPLTIEQTREVRESLAIGAEFLLAVGTIEPRKNLEVLVRAFEQIIHASPASNLQLVIAGGRGWLTDPLFENITTSPAGDRVVFTDYLQDEELRALYSSCRAFVYPSLYEGFGLPPLEAMACGAPVIASRIPALVEIAADAALFFDPHNATELAQVITKLLNDEAGRAQIANAGKARAAEFSWRRAAQETRKIYATAFETFSARQ